MTTIPRHLLDIAALADRTATPDGRDLAVRTAQTIWHCLPPEPEHVTYGRRAAMDAAMQPRRRPS